MLQLTRRSQPGTLLLSIIGLGFMALGLMVSLAGATSSATSAAGTIFICPAGDGPSLASQGLTINVTVEDVNNDPIVNYPFEDIWADDCGGTPVGGISICAGGSVADANTDANGMTTISRPLAGGGCSQVGICVYIGGVKIPTPLPIDVVSPDLSSDLVVNILDIVQFQALYFPGTYQFCVDFNHDGDLNMCDIALFLEHVNHECP